MMTDQNNHEFNTDFKYAIVAGWLIIPAINVLFSFLGFGVIVFFVNPLQLEGVELATYIFSLISLLFLVYIIYMWINRKRILPILMIIFYVLISAENLIYLISGYGEEFLSVIVNIIWIAYFIRSKRVKATFTK
ncbi:MAG TPA: DUF2569 family protein [Candidatus Avamphibacillus sp.]|nr:DUF2569 family protein [Candidatus Avamphibacillus sp.]